MTIDGDIEIKDNKVGFFNFSHFQDVLAFEKILVLIETCVSEAISEYNELIIKKAKNKETYPQ